MVEMIEEREEFMCGATGGVPVRRKAHFLKSTVPAMGASSSFQQPFLSPKCSWPMSIDFNGWRDPQKKWAKWVDRLQAKHHDLWKKAGIFEAIQVSKCMFIRNDELINGFAERWCPDSNTFVFPWGEATITLEDMAILGGFSVLGSSAFSPVSGAGMAEVEERLRKVPASLRNHHNWLDHFMKSGGSIEHEAFLCLWISRFVLPGHEVDRIGEHVFPVAVNLSRGVRVALAPTLLANIYRDLGILKVTMAVSSSLEEDENERKSEDRAESDGDGEGKTQNILFFSLWAPFQFVQLWVWERFLVFRPEPNFLKAGEVRAKRWNGLGRKDIGNVRPIINTCGDVFIWRPYCLAIDEWSFPKFYEEKERSVLVSKSGKFMDEALESYARVLRESVLVGTDGNEPYQPHRVAMQFGLDQDLPTLIPRPSDCAAAAWDDYSKPFPSEFSLYLPARLFEGDLSIKYKKWWNGSVLVPVQSFPGVLKGVRTSKALICPRIHRSKQEKTSCAFCCRLRASSSVVQIKTETYDADVPPGFPGKAKDDPPASSSVFAKNVGYRSAGCPIILNKAKDGPPVSNPVFPNSVGYRSAGCPIILNKVKKEYDDTSYPTGHLKRKICQFLKQ